MNVDHPAAGPTLLPGSPLRFSNAEVDFSSPSPLAGQHTGEILSELSYRSEEIEEMQREGVVQAPLAGKRPKEENPPAG